MFEAPLELVFTNVQLANYVWWLERPKHSKILDVRRTKISHKHLPGIFDFSDLNSLNELAALFRRTDINDYIVHTLYFDDGRTLHDICVKESANTWKWVSLKHK